MVTKRAHELHITVATDTVKDLARELRHIADRVELGALDRGCAGNPYAETSYVYKQNKSA